MRCAQSALDMRIRLAYKEIKKKQQQIGDMTGIRGNSSKWSDQAEKLKWVILSATQSAADSLSRPLDSPGTSTKTPHRETQSGERYRNDCAFGGTWATLKNHPSTNLRGKSVISLGGPYWSITFSLTSRVETSTRYCRATRVLGIYSDRRKLWCKVACGDYFKAYLTFVVM